MGSNYHFHEWLTREPDAASLLLTLCLLREQKNRLCLWLWWDTSLATIYILQSLETTSKMKADLCCQKRKYTHFRVPLILEEKSFSSPPLLHCSSYLEAANCVCSMTTLLPGAYQVTALPSSHQTAFKCTACINCFNRCSYHILHFNLLLLFLLCVYLYMCLFMCVTHNHEARAVVWVWESEDFGKWGIFFHCGVRGSDSGCQTCAATALCVDPSYWPIILVYDWGN